jgi:hypothetical protein
MHVMLKVPLVEHLIVSSISLTKRSVWVLIPCLLHYSLLQQQLPDDDNSGMEAEAAEVTDNFNCLHFHYTFECTQRCIAAS